MNKPIFFKVTKNNQRLATRIYQQITDTDFVPKVGTWVRVGRYTKTDGYGNVGWCMLKPSDKNFFAEKGLRELSLSRNRKQIIGLAEAILGCGLSKEVVLSQESYHLELNSEYSATVTKSGIEVGCQTFDWKVVKELEKLRKKLKVKSNRSIFDYETICSS
jgi:hypothetical protein